MIPTFSILGSGPTVILLHGIGGGHTAFAPQVESLAGAGYRAVAWDMPGYGRSAPIEPYTFKGLAQRLLDLIDALRCDNVTLVGHSMGGMVAQELVARKPERVNRLVLCGTSAAFAQRSDRTRASDWAQRFIAQRTGLLDAGLSMEQLAQRLIPQMVGPGALPEGLRLAEFCLAQVPSATYRRALDALVTFDRQRELAQIGVPTLLIGGEFDRVAAPAVMRQMAAAIPLARYAEMPGIGHLMNLEAPETFDALLLEFLREPRPAARRDLH
jgi:pimeloyl-ACP methyl ester carboxylesterase